MTFSETVWLVPPAPTVMPSAAVVGVGEADGLGEGDGPVYWLPELSSTVTFSSTGTPSASATGNGSTAHGHVDAACDRTSVGATADLVRARLTNHF